MFATPLPACKRVTIYETTDPSLVFGMLLHAVGKRSEFAVRAHYAYGIHLPNDSLVLRVVHHQVANC
jgi:hypothetical protein